METIQSIIDFEEQKLFECQELIKRHSERAKELGVEIIPVLDRCRAVNHDGLVEVHNWDQDMWLPHYYNSRITCYIYKDGEMLEERTSPTSVSHFVNIYWLVYAGKKDTLRFNEKPFEQFDGQFDRLLDSVFVYLQQ